MRIDKNTRILLGNTPIVKIKKGNVLIWEYNSQPVVESDYFYIENTYNGTNTLSIVKSSSGTVPSGTYATSIEYSKDKSTWTSINITGETQTISMNIGEKVYFRNNSEKFSTHTSNDDTLCYSFRNSQSCNAGGNILTLLDYTNVERNTVPDGCFEKLFENNTGLVDASQLDITPQTMPFRAFSGAFWGCSSLTAVPELKATTVGEKCYQNMFRECTSLVTGPVMRATTLGDYACQQMFLNSTSLNSFTVYVNTKENTSTNNWLKGVASTGTFRNLGAATYTTGNVSGIPTGWIEGGYVYLKNTSQDTGSLWINVEGSEESPSSDLYTNTIQYSKDKVNWTTLDISSLDTYIINNIAPNEKVYFRNNTGKFSGVDETSNLQHTISLVLSVSNIAGGDVRTLINYNDVDNVVLPNHCFYKLFYKNSSITSASGLLLPSMTSRYCYAHMFSSCNSLTTVPALPATTLAYGCYENMFFGCTALTVAPELPATNLAQSCYSNMFGACTSLTSAPVLPATTLANNCYENMFWVCQSLTTAPALPATNLAQSCYSNMFSACTSLTSAPASLPATTLADNCYSAMFYNCTSLTSAPLLPATTLASYCYANMFESCTSLTTAPALPATTLISGSYYSMFSDCTSLNKVLTYADDISETNCTNNWLNNVSASGTFYNGGSATYTTDDPSGIPTGWTETAAPSIMSVYAVPNTFTAKSWQDKNRCDYIVIGTNNIGMDVTLSNESQLITIGQNTGSTTVTHTETLTYDGLNYSITINQTANDTDEPNYFYFENDDNNARNVTVSSTYDSGVQPTISFEYSTDKVNWTEKGSYGNITVPANGKLYLRNDTGKFSFTDEQLHRSYINFYASSNIKEVGGDITTLVDYRNNNVELPNGCFYRMFARNSWESANNILSAENLILPSRVSKNCYYNMFEKTSIVTPPVLPATTLADSCYHSMFYNCTGLTTAPSLPATTLAQSCYSNMFYGCTSLTTATTLPATTLTNNCYQQMFRGCTSLTTAPTLPATTLVDGCYYLMFYDCTSLNTVTSYAQDISANNCLYLWLSNVAATGTFNNIGAAVYPSGASGIPAGWTEVLPSVQSIVVTSGDTFTAKSYQTKKKCTSTLLVTFDNGITSTFTNTTTLTFSENTGNTTRTITQSVPFIDSSYTVTIIQTANDPAPVYSWSVTTPASGYTFVLNQNNYYESNNKGVDNSYAYCTLNYSGFDNLVLECINYAETNWDYGIISQPDVQLSTSNTDDSGGSSETETVFKNFKYNNSATPVQLTIPSDGDSHFITIKFIKDGSTAANNDSLQFKVVEPE